MDFIISKRIDTPMGRIDVSSCPFLNEISHHVSKFDIKIPEQRQRTVSHSFWGVNTAMPAYPLEQDEFRISIQVNLTSYIKKVLNRWYPLFYGSYSRVDELLDWTLKTNNVTFNLRELRVIWECYGPVAEIECRFDQFSMDFHDPYQLDYSLRTDSVTSFRSIPPEPFEMRYQF